MSDRLSVRMDSELKRWFSELLEKNFEGVTTSDQLRDMINKLKDGRAKLYTIPKLS